MNLLKVPQSAGTHSADASVVVTNQLVATSLGRELCKAMRIGIEDGLTRKETNYR